jgi:hypothetical protein
MLKLHDELVNLITQYDCGIITGLEFTHAVTHHIAKPFDNIMMSDLHNLIDVNTGLRYQWNTTGNPDHNADVNPSDILTGGQNV